MGDEFDASHYDIGTTSIRLVRAGNIVQIVFSSAIEARFIYMELAERYKRAEDRLRGAQS